MRQRYYLMLLILQGFYFSSFAQKSFLRICPGIGADRLIEWSDSSYLLCGNSLRNDSSGQELLTLTELDSSGGIIGSHDIVIDTFAGDTVINTLPSIYSIPYTVFRNHLLAGVVLETTSGTLKGALLSLDSSLNLESINSLNSSYGLAYVHQILARSENEVIVFGAYQVANKLIRTFVNSYDAGLKIRWQKIFENPNGHAIPGHILLTKNGFIIGVEYQGDFSGGTPRSYSGDIILLDSNGNKIKNIGLSNANGSISNLKVTTSGTSQYLAAWNDDYINDPQNPNNKIKPNDYATIWLMQFDADGKVAWRKSLAGTIMQKYGKFITGYMTNIDILTRSDGNILIAGTFITDPVGYVAYLANIDSLGKLTELKGFNFFNNTDTLSVITQEFHSLVETKNHAIISAMSYTCSNSTVFPDGTQISVAVKFGRDGCIEGSCGMDFITGMNEIPPKSEEFKIYPNPAATSMTLQIPFATEYQFVICNAQGQVVKEGAQKDKCLGIGTLKQGLYFLRVTCPNDKRILSAPFVKI